MTNYNTTYIDMWVRTENKDLFEKFIEDLDIDFLEYLDEDIWEFSGERYDGYKLERYIKDYLDENKEIYKDKMEVYFDCVDIHIKTKQLI